MGGADADRGRTQRAAVRCVRLDPAAADPDDHDGRPVAGGGDTARLQGRRLDGDLLAVAHQGHRVGVLVAHEDHRARCGRVVGLVADMSVRHHLAARQRELEQLVDLLRGDKDWAGGSGELQVPGRTRQPYYPADPPGGDVHQRHRVWPAQADREDTVRIVHGQPFGGSGHGHHGARRPFGQWRRFSRFRHIGPHRNGTMRGPGRASRTGDAGRPASGGG